MKLSIKWKLSLALITTGLSLVLGYVFIAKQVFENDKISYVFDSQNARLLSQKRDLQQRFEKALLIARGIVATYDPAKGLLTGAGDQIFHEEKSLLALELWNEKLNQTVFSLEKHAGVLSPDESTGFNELQMKALGGDRFLLKLGYHQGDARTPLRLRTVVEFKGLFPPAETTHSFLLLQQGRLISEMDLSKHPHFEKMIQDIEGDQSDRTLIWGEGSDRYLVSTANVGIGNLRLVTVTPEAVALGALGTLFRRSILFLLFSTCGLIAVSLTLAKSLTLNLEILTKAATKIGLGNFDAVPLVPSQDEMGVLSTALSKMSEEIQGLLVETRDKARMEAELKTAKLVQDRLLPNAASCSINELEISGVALTSSECGGDWWYYFTKGDDLYVVIADATGHGTPAALITAAARSIFSRLESENLSLATMMQVWDLAVKSCSQGKVFMTGILLKINSLSGRGEYISAGHEAPYILHECEEGYAFDYLDLDVNKSLGDGISESVKAQSFQMAPNSSLILYTDGIFSIERPDGKTLSEKRFGNALAGRGEFAQTAESMTHTVLSIFEEHRSGHPMPDDVTVVSVRRKGPRREISLASDSGDLLVTIK